MDPLIGAALAAMVAWISILVAVHVPWRPHPRGLRWGGALALVLVALMVWGVAVPPWAPLVALTLGLVAGSVQLRPKPDPES